jgi:hypothetical protein
MRNCEPAASLSHGRSSDVREARELCNSGHPEEGNAMLRGVLNSLNDNE